MTGDYKFEKSDSLLTTLAGDVSFLRTYITISHPNKFILFRYANSLVFLSRTLLSFVRCSLMKIDSDIPGIDKPGDVLSKERFRRLEAVKISWFLDLEMNFTMMLRGILLAPSMWRTR